MCAEATNKGVFIRSWKKQGLSGRLARAYYRSLKRSGLSLDADHWTKDCRYLLQSKKKYGDTYESYIGDAEYQFLKPFNNSFAKWMNDLVTVNNVLISYREHLPKLFLNIIDREHKKIFLPTDAENTGYDGVGFEKLTELFDGSPRLSLRPTSNKEENAAYVIECAGEDEYYLFREHIGLPEPADKVKLSGKVLEKFISSLGYDCVVAEPYKLRDNIGGTVRVYAANTALKDTEILDAYLMPWSSGEFVPVRDGMIAGWSGIKAQLSEMFSFISEVEYFTADIVLTEDGFVIDRFCDAPELPPIAHSMKLNNYLLCRLEEKNKRIDGTKINRFRVAVSRCFRFYVEKFCRPGMRPYMQKVWMKSVLDDMLHTKSVNIFKKQWCYNHGFLSFRIQQYGLTKDNYRDFLSDYQYHWLNRINNDYQIWVNDKLTTRYVLEPNKQYLAKYYYVVAKMQEKSCIKTLQDIPEGYGASLDEVFRLLRSEKLLALKPASGAHGDGFYRMEYSDGKYLINGNEMSEEEIREMIEGFKSVYVITEYLFMHRELRKIYPDAVNTIRVAVVNRSGNEPEIMQTYMRIGSSKSGYTDNVAYGGICAKIDLDTGRYHSPERLYKHKFTPCPRHPDTDVEISGTVPNWEYMKKGVVNICRSMPELEYLGFDIAITDDGFKVIEINIHQDLHKVAEHSREFRNFYKDKLKLKAEQYGLKKW